MLFFLFHICLLSFPWVILICHDILWFLMIFRDLSWFFVICHPPGLKSMKNICFPIGFHGFSWFWGCPGGASVIWIWSNLDESGSNLGVIWDESRWIWVGRSTNPLRNFLTSKRWFRGSEGSIGSIGSLVPRVPSERRFSRVQFRFRWFRLRGFRFFEGFVVPLFRCFEGSVLQLFRCFHYGRTRTSSRGVGGFV